jgi:hypothetical protein
VDLNTAIQTIDTFLSGRLRDTSNCLVSVLVPRATDQEFRLSSSGRQFGGDAASKSWHANRIKIEAKHHRETTPLDLRELIAEIEEAAKADANLDVWVLATSRSVSEQISSAMEEQAESHGIEVLLLDLGLLARQPIRCGNG